MPKPGRLFFQATLIGVIATGELASATTPDKKMRECMALLSAGQTVPSEHVRIVLASLFPTIDVWKNANVDSGSAFYARAMVGDIPLNVEQVEFLGKFASSEFLPGLEGILRALEFASGRTNNMSLTIFGIKLERNLKKIQERTK